MLPLCFLRLAVGRSPAVELGIGALMGTPLSSVGSRGVRGIFGGSDDPRR